MLCVYHLASVYYKNITELHIYGFVEKVHFRLLFRIFRITVIIILQSFDVCFASRPLLSALFLSPEQEVESSHRQHIAERLVLTKMCDRMNNLVSNETFLLCCVELFWAHIKRFSLSIVLCMLLLLRANAH